MLFLKSKDLFLFSIFYKCKHIKMTDVCKLIYTQTNSGSTWAHSAGRLNLPIGQC